MAVKRKRKIVADVINRPPPSPPVQKVPTGYIEMRDVREGDVIQVASLGNREAGVILPRTDGKFEMALRTPTYTRGAKREIPAGPWAWYIFEADKQFRLIETSAI